MSILVAVVLGLGSTLRWARPTASRDSRRHALGRLDSRASGRGGLSKICSYPRPEAQNVFRGLWSGGQLGCQTRASSRSFHHRCTGSSRCSECRELIPALVLRHVPRRLPCALRQSSVCTHSCAQTINNNMPRGQNSQVILRQRPAAPPCGASRLARLIPVSDAAARRETRTTRPVALTATAAPRTTTRTATDPTTTLTTTGRLTTTRRHRRRLRRCTPLLLRSKVPSRLEKFAGCSLEFGPYPQFRH